MINVTFDIRINDDTIMENNENFLLSIDQSSLPTHVTVGSPHAIVTIMDNDGKHYFCHDNICI